MRTVLALLLAAALGACGSDGTDDGGDVGGDDDGTTDPPDAPDSEILPDLLLESPEIAIDPGTEVTYCWYFRTSNTKPLAIKEWRSNMSPGSHHMIVYTTQNQVMEPGTVSTVNCGPGSGFAMWTYSSQTPDDSLLLPTDDGAGKPLAIEIGAGQAGFIQMHYNNRTDQTIQAHVKLAGYALGEGVAFTKTAAFVTYNGEINIPAQTTGDVEAKTCSVPQGVKFWMMSTHSHKQSVRTVVKDGQPTNGSIIFESTDWEHPGAKRWDQPFYSFNTNKLTYECTYNNPTNRTIRTGDSAQTDEMCMASGYFFPATRPMFCFNNITL
jgi:Copper type II ascorbate-dependent monooxygenase, C-terminal domain